MSVRRIMLGCVVVAVVGVTSAASATARSSGASSTHGPAPRWPAPKPDRVVALTEAAGLTAEKKESLQHHVHAHLDVYVDGKRVTVPAAIGIKIDDPEVKHFAVDGQTAYGRIDECNEPCISPLHTHDVSGILHTESATAVDNTLGQVFTEWDVKLTADCVDAYCTPGTADRGICQRSQTTIYGRGQYRAHRPQGDRADNWSTTITHPEDRRLQPSLTWRSLASSTTSREPLPLANGAVPRPGLTRVPEVPIGDAPGTARSDCPTHRRETERRTAHTRVAQIAGYGAGTCGLRCCAERCSVRRSTSDDSTLHTGRQATVGDAGTVRFPGAGGLSDPSPRSLFRRSRPSLRSRLLRCLAGRCFTRVGFAVRFFVSCGQVLYARSASRCASSWSCGQVLHARAPSSSSSTDEPG